MIAFRAGKPKQPLLENWILSVPQGNRKANQLMAVGNTGDTVFIPAVRFRPRVIMRQIVPCSTVRTIILANRAPRPLAEVGSPALPVHKAVLRFLQSLFFSGHKRLPL